MVVGFIGTLLLVILIVVILALVGLFTVLKKIV
jgi:hypothetical protein